MALYFSKRRLVAMLEELSPLLTYAKKKDLVSRLNKADVDQALPAEIELALLWAIKQTGSLQVEAEWLPGNDKPDAFTEGLIEGRPAVVEITAVNNGRIAFEKEMVATANRISEFAISVKRRFDDRLWFEFPYENSSSRDRHKRIPTARLDYKVSEAGKALLRGWINLGEDRPEYIDYRDGEVLCRIRCSRSLKLPVSQRVWTTVPPETHDLVDNPLYEALDRKRKQLANVTRDMARVIFIADGGSDLLRNIGRASATDWTNPRTGDQIINNFIKQKISDIDAVIVFTPRRRHNDIYGYFISGQNDLIWHAHCFVSAEFGSALDGLERIVQALPKPEREGYQARTMGQQFHTSPLKDRPYNGFKMTTNMKSIEIRVSSKALLDLIAGHPFDEIMKDTFPEQIPLWRAGGYSIVDASFCSEGIDADDDYVVLRLERDPAKVKFVI